ncbi:ABC transporter substrate-binding protein [Methanogenium cariaci]
MAEGERMRVNGNCKWLVIVLLLAVVSVFFAGCTAGDASGVTPDPKTAGTGFRTVTDSRGVEVQVPENIERVVSVSDGLIEGTMFALGVGDKIVAHGSSCIPGKGNWTYSYSTTDGIVNGTGGKHVEGVLMPHLNDLPQVMNHNMAMNYETLCSLEPDVVIMRPGCCTVPTTDSDKIEKTIRTLESLGIPLVVLHSPNCYDRPNLKIISDEINIIGEVFGKEEEAERIAGCLESRLEMIKERTGNIPEEEKSKVLMFGLSSYNAQYGYPTNGPGVSYGLGTTESYMVEGIVNAKNAYRSDIGSYQMLSTEQVLALDPDVVVLSTWCGHHPADELYHSTNYQNLHLLSAVENNRVASLPFMPCNCVRRLEYPIELMVIANAAYPERFSDIDQGEWLLSFYMDVYGVDEVTAKALRSAQWMDWCADE